MLRDLCMGSCSQVVHEQITCPPETCSTIDLFRSQLCSCYSSFHWIKDLTRKHDLFWHGCESHAWYVERSSTLPMRALFTRSNEIHGYNTRHASKGNYIRKEAKLEIFKCSFLRTGAMLWNEISPNWRDVSKPTFKKTIRRFLFETLSDRDDYVEVDTLTQFLKSYT